MDEYVAAPVPDLLRPYLAALEGYRITGAEPGIHVGMPSRHLTIIITLDDGIDVASNDPKSRPTRFAALVAGLHAEPAHIHHDGNQFGLQLSLTPAGARALLGAPAAQFQSGSVPLADVLGPLGTRIRERVGSARTWPERFAVVTQELAAIVDGGAVIEAPVRRAWKLLARSRGGIPIGAVAQDVGWSARHLTDRFAREFGPTPKLAGRMMRFERSRALIGRAALADIAIRCGYADQSHLVRDWRQFAGASPTQWLRGDTLARRGEATGG
ncbi:MAG: helix-turn-helix domain-containing protein [Tetrasphaera sp.]